MPPRIAIILYRKIHAYLSDTVRSSPHIALSSMFQLTQKQQVALCGADWLSVLLPLLLPCGTCHPCCCPTTQHKPDCNLQGHHASLQWGTVLTIHSPDIGVR